MKINLQKGENQNIQALGMDKIRASVGWTDGSPKVDIDLSVICTDSADNAVEIVFYQKGFHANSNKSITYSGDARNGGCNSGSDEDEFMDVLLSQLPEEVKKLKFIISIYDETNSITFNNVQNAFVKITGSGEEVDFDLKNEFSYERAIIVGEFYKYNGDWHFMALGQPEKDFSTICNLFGIETE